MAQANQQDPTLASDPSDSASSGTGGDFVVCIAAQTDGSFQVFMEDGDDSGGQGGDASDTPQSADNVDDALELARQLIEQAQGDAGGDASASDADADDDAPLPASDAKSVWNQMAKRREAAKGSP